jgi:copper homeostasis protein CutC
VLALLRHGECVYPMLSEVLYGVSAKSVPQASRVMDLTVTNVDQCCALAETGVKPSSGLVDGADVAPTRIRIRQQEFE